MDRYHTRGSFVNAAAVLGAAAGSPRGWPGMAVGYAAGFALAFVACCVLILFDPET